MSGRHLREQWVDVAHASTVQRGPGSQTIVIRFTDSEQARAFFETCCTGRETTSGEIRHDEELHCPVHS